jgi:integrase
MREERRVLDKFEELVKPRWCHEVTTADREVFIQKRLPEIDAPISVEKDLRILRYLFNVLEEWNHCQKESNPFAGTGKATIGTKRRKSKELERRKAGGEKPKFFTVSEVQALLNRADVEVAEHPDDWVRMRLRALLYFEAYTGSRLNEALHLEWDDIDLDQGIAWLKFKIEKHLKTAESEAPIGLSDSLIEILLGWKLHRKCSWVFPNLVNDRPWTSGSKGYKPLDQLKDLATRAGIEHATWQQFRHTLSTIGKADFGLNEDQVKDQLRHTTIKTQKHYTHDYLDGLRRAANSIQFGTTK